MYVRVMNKSLGAILVPICLLAGCASAPEVAQRPVRGEYFASLADLRRSPAGSSSGVEALAPLSSEMDLSKARELAWDGAVTFWVVLGDQEVCLVAEMTVLADPTPDEGRIYEPVSLGAGTTLAFQCQPTSEFEAEGVTLEANSSATQVAVTLLADGHVPEGQALPKIAGNLFGTVRDSL